MHMPLLSPVPSDFLQKHPIARYFTWICFRRRWELMEDWSYDFETQGQLIIIPKGFEFDGVSIPKCLHWFLSPTGVLFIPGLIHDFAYRYGYIWVIDEHGKVQKYQEGSSRHFWDTTFEELGLEVNKMVFLNRFARVVLWSFGWCSWRKNRKKPFHELKPGSL
jgi:hypothetical protein